MVALTEPPSTAHKFRVAIARRTGPLLPLITENDFADWCITERHTCIDTTASGGNASLLGYSN